MPIDIQAAGVTRGLIERFGIKGRFRPRLDDIVVPVVITGDVSPSQLDRPTYQDAATAAAVVGEVFAMTIAGGNVPQFPFTTELIELRIRSIGTGQLVNIIANNTTAIVLTGPADLVGINRLNPQVAPASPIIAAIGTQAAVGGAIVETVQCAADTDVVVDLRGWELPAGPANLGQFARLLVQGTTTNVSVGVSLKWAIRQPSGS